MATEVGEVGVGSPREPGPNPCACSPESVRARGFARRAPTCTHRGPWGNVPCAFMCVRECRRPAGRRWLRKARGTGPSALVIAFYGTLYCMQSGLGNDGSLGVRSLVRANTASVYRKTSFSTQRRHARDEPAGAQTEEELGSGLVVRLVEEPRQALWVARVFVQV